MRASTWTLFLGLIVTALACGETMAVEEAKYSVIDRKGDFELRRYEAQVVAETLVQGDFSTVGNDAFHRLYGYISGRNRKARSIPMTAPVSQEAESEKIAMTAPVSQERAGDKWRIAFMMPAGLSLAELPEPTDPLVVLREIPGRTMAVITYTGTWSRKRYDKHLAVLMQHLRKLGLKQTGEPVFARYNPPFTPWFLRRNEILIPVDQTR